MSARRLASYPASELHLVLREELAARGWGSGRLAKELGVRPGVISRWLQPSPKKRVIPLPFTCVEIARVLGLDPVDVFRAAGYLPMQEPVADDPQQMERRRLKRKQQRILEGVRDPHWLVVALIADAMLDQLAAIILRLDDLTP